MSGLQGTSEIMPAKDDSGATVIENWQRLSLESTVQQHSTLDQLELQRIASVLTTTISRLQPPKDSSSEGTLSELSAKDPHLDPKHPDFSFSQWAKTLLQKLESQGLMRPRSGFTFKNLTVLGNGETVQFQPSVGALPMTAFRKLSSLHRKEGSEKQILSNFNGTVNSGEMLLVLGRPGSGCSTFLKSICGESKGLRMTAEAIVHYHGVPQSLFVKELRGDIVYNQENEQHFPQLTVGQTLRFAAASRAARPLLGLSRSQLVEYVADIAMNVFGLRHVRDTRVGDDFVRGVSGGERKRVTIAEMAVSRAPIAAWDNSTKGLDAATALNFIQTLKVSSTVWGTTHSVAVYQASQSIFDVFDKVTLLYEGRQVYFGTARGARAYFEEMGWACPTRQTTPDFLTAVTNPAERQPRTGFESQVPRTAEEFETYWHSSAAYQQCLEDIVATERDYPVGGHALEQFREFHHLNQSKHTRGASPYRISVPIQVRLCITRSFQLMWNEKTPIATRILTQLVLALIVGSVFYGTPDSTNGFYAKGSILFISVLVNAFLCVSEITSLFSQRPIVQKHFSYAFYHPFAEALAGVIVDIPVKLICLTIFSLVLYFLGGLRYEAGPFFVFFLFSFAAVMTMSAIFRTVAAATKTVAQAMMIAGTMILAIAMYTGFTVPRGQMHPWFKWINYINPVAYAFESLLVNEIHGRSFPCDESSVVPPYGTGSGFQCAVPGATRGDMDVSGDAWASATYEYSYSHLWRNLAILFAFMAAFYSAYLILTERNSQSASAGEHLIFKNGYVPRELPLKTGDDEMHRSEIPQAPPTYDSSLTFAEKPAGISSQHADVFSWRDVTLDIPVKGGQRRLLDHVSGWVRPGTLTALMGVSGAGKTTLLDTLAQRMSVGVLTGEMLVNGRSLDESFQRKTGYVQQQDVHVDTTTVREALRFSAMLRQPKTTSLEEKYEWVEQVIGMLDMSDFSEAIVGQPGQGLNAEQRKRLTIGVELAAKPSLLLFLDEPTSGLDSTSAWSIVTLLRRVADSGQAVLSTIHQPSAVLFQQFDRLLFLAKGGRTVYFGDVGEQSQILLDYFESAGARKCGASENPAEYILDIVGSSNGDHPQHDWPEIWKSSKQVREVQTTLNGFQESSHKQDEHGRDHSGKFALPLGWQIVHVTKRTFQQYWRSPRYVMGRIMLALVSSLFSGFTFYSQDTSQAGMQGSIFAIFMVTTLFTPLVLQIMPQFVAQRALYEVREKPSKAYSWVAFLFSIFAAELFYQLLAGVVVFLAWYFAVFGINQTSLTQGLMLVFCLLFYLFVGTFALMVISALPDETTAANVATLLFSMMLIFDGVLQSPSDLPAFWTFMWRTSPLTYLMGGAAATALSDRAINCAADELAVFDPPSGANCAEYLKPFFQAGALGNLHNPLATSNCQYCSLSNGRQFLALKKIYPSQTYRNIGIFFVYIGFNLAAAILLYYTFRVRRGSILRKIIRRVKT